MQKNFPAGLESKETAQEGQNVKNCIAGLECQETGQNGQKYQETALQGQAVKLLELSGGRESGLL